MSFKKYLLEQKFEKGLIKEIVLVEYNAELGKQIAKSLGIHYKGYWDDVGKFMFDIPESGTSFVAKDFAEAERKLHAKRLLFKGKKNPFLS